MGMQQAQHECTAKCYRCGSGRQRQAPVPAAAGSPPRFLGGQLLIFQPSFIVQLRYKANGNSTQHLGVPASVAPGATE